MNTELFEEGKKEYPESFEEVKKKYPELEKIFNTIENCSNNCNIMFWELYRDENHHKTLINNLRGFIDKDCPTICKQIQFLYTKLTSKEPLNIELSDVKKDLLKELVSKYFRDKQNNGTLIFEKKCRMSSVLKDDCKSTILGRVKTFVKGVKQILGVEKIPDDFKLVSIVDGISSESIRDITNYLSTPSSKHVDGDEYLEELRKMCLPVQEEHIPHSLNSDLEELYDANDQALTTGGRRSRYRRRPTKKYFKSRHRRHSSPKKKRHMKTKRHMKRHRKTKRHTKRH